MSTTRIIQDMFDHNDWANCQLLARCREFADSQLDQPREMGFGSLRNTLFHILEAEKLWLERWQGKPWRPLVHDSEGISVAGIANGSGTIAETRTALIDAESKTDFSRIVEFQDSQGNRWAFPIDGLLFHVANHGIHHRAQVLSFLREQTQKTPGGVDYILWKLARPSCDQPAKSIQSFRAIGLEIATAPGKMPQFDKIRIRRYFQYNDWAMHRVLDAATGIGETALDHGFAMGPGNLRTTFQHLIDAERWWQSNWHQDNTPFPQGEPTRSLPELIRLYDDTAKHRNRFVDSLNESGANQELSVFPRGPEVRVRVTESLIQLCGHGTHHRAQALNMLRHLGAKPPAIDWIVWLRDLLNSSLE